MLAIKCTKLNKNLRNNYSKEVFETKISRNGYTLVTLVLFNNKKVRFIVIMQLTIINLII